MRKISFELNEFYHIYNRGVEKRLLYMDKLDHERFIKLLFFCNSLKRVNIRDLPKGLAFVEFNRGETIVDIGAYCLMPNHFHILVREKTENGISTFIQKLLTGYTMYFNAKNKRKGRLFESTFQAVHANSDEYLKYLFAYIHLNPAKLVDPTWKEVGVKSEAKINEFLNNYQFSSFLDYSISDTERDYSQVLSKKAFPHYFTTSDEFQSNIFDWLNYTKA